MDGTYGDDKPKFHYLRDFTVESDSNYDVMISDKPEVDIEKEEIDIKPFGYPDVKNAVGCSENVKFKLEQEYDRNTEDISLKDETKYTDFVQTDNIDVNLKTEEIELKHEQRDFESTLHNCEEDYLNHKIIKDNHTKDGIFEKHLYSCDRCAFKTAHKRCLKLHWSTYQHYPEVIWHGCEECSFKTKFKYNLKSHMLTHQNPSEVKTYNCGSCSYVTKLKGGLKKHILIHQNKSYGDFPVLTCEKCSYETKNIRCLRKHQRTQHSSLDTTVFKCELCIYESRNKKNLKSHMAIHGNPKYSCESCSYMSTRKQYLKNHQLKWHPSICSNNCMCAPVMHKCKSCSYKSKYRSDLRKHTLIHLAPSEITMYSCETCSFKTKRKPALKMHMLIHRDTSDVPTYTCELCSYETKHLYYLKRHLRRTHKTTFSKCEK